jgi:hypothetical protein
VDLRIERIYISPSTANLRNLQWILHHPRHRIHVREIVWDDAQLEEFPTLESFRQVVAIDETEMMCGIERCLEDAILHHQEDNSEYRALERDDFFGPDEKLSEFAKGILLQVDDDVSRRFIARDAALMTMEESYEVYQRLYREEQEIKKQGADVVALQQALKNCPGLRKVVIASQLWQYSISGPRYDTPFHRSLPVGLRKPSVWAWLGENPDMTLAQRSYRDKSMGNNIFSELPNDWRGYSIVVAALYHHPDPNIEEFILETENELTGITHHLFTFFHRDCVFIANLFEYLPLKRVKFALNGYEPGKHASPAMHSTRFFKNALRQLHCVEHLDLSFSHPYPWLNNHNDILVPVEMFNAMELA